MYYCSTDNDVGKCDVVDTSEGYYAVGGGGTSPDKYIKCSGTNCLEVSFGSYDTCGSK